VQVSDLIFIRDAAQKHFFIFHLLILRLPVFFIHLRELQNTDKGHTFVEFKDSSVVIIEFDKSLLGSLLHRLIQPGVCMRRGDSEEISPFLCVFSIECL
jgi:hypothetical protein